MTSRDAREILLLYRAGPAEPADADTARALELTRKDPELGAWFQRHCELQSKVRNELRNLPVPPRPKMVIPLPETVLPVSWWRRPLTVAAAAAIVLLAGIALLWLRPASANLLANFQERMVGTALREYRMDVLTADMRELRRYLGSTGAPADYEIPSGLQHLKLTGGGTLRWRSHPVSMVCFDRGDKQMLFLFVVPKDAVDRPPPAQPWTGSVRDLAVVRWTRGNNVYLLAGPPEQGFLNKYIGRS